MTVDLLLSGYRLFGVTYQVSESVRLGDLLNSTGETVALKHASVLGLKGQVMATLPEVSIEKRHLVAAIPKESEEFQNKQRAYRAGMVKPDQVHQPVLAIAPPYAASGKVHLPPNTDLHEADHSGLARFFPITDATLFMGEDRLYQGPILLLNRDMVAMLGKTGQPSAPEKPLAQAPDDNPLMRIVGAEVRR
ncbi:MAG TPA: hypothetical protein VH951_04825 [Dehalococcoidia bacterium]